MCVWLERARADGLRKWWSWNDKLHLAQARADWTRVQKAWSFKVHLARAGSSGLASSPVALKCHSPFGSSGLERKAKRPWMARTKRTIFGAKIGSFSRPNFDTISKWFLDKLCSRFGHHFGAPKLTFCESIAGVVLDGSKPIRSSPLEPIAFRTSNRIVQSGPEINKNSIGFLIVCLMCFLLLLGWILEVKRRPTIEQQLDHKWSRKRSVFWRSQFRKAGGYGGPGDL
jgi:hypothetical protein